MTDESIGTARLDLVVDTTQFNAAIDLAKRSVSSMSQEAQRDYNQLSAAEKRRVDSLVRQADTLKLTRAEQIAYNAALKGVPTSILDELKVKLAAQESATKGLTDANNKYVMSEKARAAALRGVPAQITDIVTGLAAGQRPITVLLQQGGQLKDMFGGIGPAAGALGRGLVSLVNPATLVAASIAGLVYVMKQGEDQSEAFRNAVVLTGHQIGVTADQLAASAGTIKEQVGGSFGGAAEALTKVASTGQFVGAQIETIARAAVSLNRATGAAIDDTIAQFVRLADDPVKAAEALDKQFRFLAQSTKDEIAALVEQGRVQEATTLLVNQYADAVESRSREVVENAGWMARSWRAVKDAVAGALDAASSIGRDPTLTDQLQKQTVQLAELQAQANSGVRFRWNLDGIVDINKEIDKTKASINLIQDQLMGQSNLSVATAAANRIETDGAAGKRILEAATKQYATTIDKYQQERQKIVDAAAAALKADPGNEKKILDDKAKALKGLDEQYQKAVDGQVRAAAALAKPGQTLIQRLQEQIAANEQDAASTDKLTASQRLRISVEADLKAAGEKVGTADRASIKVLLDKLEATDKLNKSETDRAKAAEQLARLQAQLRAQEQNQKDANGADLAELGHGSDQVEQIRRRLDIERGYTDGLKQLRDRGVAENTESYRVQEEALRKSRDTMLGVEEDYQTRRLALMDDWTNGARRAVEDINFQASDTAGNFANLVQSTYGSLSDFITNAVTKGKLGIKDLVSSILTEVARLEANKAAAALISYGVGLFTGDGGASSTVAANAKGDVFNSPDLSAFSGKIVDKPTFFNAYAKGGNVMGEAGPEAIMPLTRTSDGKLGVKSQGGSGDTIFDIDVTVNADGSSSVDAAGADQAMGKRFGSAIKSAVKQTIAEEQRPGGSLWRSRVNA
jgi:lambda family phage tail tape measure protein